MDDSSNSPGSCASSNEENNVPAETGARSKNVVEKICQVCGDKAKSYHFGGLCCESCKAFFRRSMQNDGYKTFLCIHGQKCVIRKENRRGCQYCRVQKCFSIGMEKGWLRTDEEIIKMKELKLVNASKNRPKTPEPTAAASSTSAAIAKPSCSQKDQSPAVPYEPKFEEISLYLSEDDVKLIETIVESYWKAYRQVPFGAEVTQNSTPRTGLQVISMFTTGIRRWAYFAKSRSEYSSLCRQDQASLLQAAVMQLSILRAVASFRMQDKEWRINTPVNQFTPSLSLEDVQRLLSPQLAEIHLTFISSMHKLCVDEATIMLLSLITLFTAESPDLIERSAVAAVQEDYILLLQRYCSWKYGPDDKGKTFANLLAKMSDLRELSDLHSDHQVRFANQDLQKLYREINNEQSSPIPMEGAVPTPPPQPDPHPNMDLNNTNQFLSAMEFSIRKTHQTLPADPVPSADPALRQLEQIEEICADLDVVVEGDHQYNNDIDIDNDNIDPDSAQIQ